ncbi:MAG TPA: MBOAT family protein [Verrucomicrobiae bacterium]|nr:MBOAT family protein [Verrucomicrobiae bacterium]
MIFLEHHKVAAIRETRPVEFIRTTGARTSNVFAWLPIIILPATAILLVNSLQPWVFMWAISFALFFGCKWLTWWQDRRSGTPIWRNLAYLFAWPGMDATEFLNAEPRTPRPPLLSWLKAVLRTLFGIWLLWGLTPVVPAAWFLVKGWTGMTGVVFILHFGTFDLLALGWQTLGVNATPLMNAPILSTSLAEFWGHRWNTAFNRIAHDLVFRPLYRRMGAAGATLMTFLASGLVHDLILSVPARAGYGLPTAYFLLQGTGLLWERTRFGRKFISHRAGRGRLFTLVLTAIPAFWLFHPAFIRNVILPMLQAIGAN